MPEIHEILNATNYQDYVKELPPVNDIVTTLFPTRKIESFELEYIVGASQVPIAASVHAQDSETQIAEREGLEIVKHELTEVRRKIALTARDAQIIETPRSDAELKMKIAELYNDAHRMQQSVETRFKAMALEAFTTGKITFNENDYRGSVDYKVPNDHKVTPGTKWDADTGADILGDLKKWSDLLQASMGYRPNKALMSQRVANFIVADESIRKALYGTNSEMIATIPRVNELFVQMGLPQIVVYDEFYRKPKTKGVGYDRVRFTPEDTIVLYIDGAQGTRTFGTTDEELVFRRANRNTGIEAGNVFIDTFTDNDPATFWTRASGKGLPSFPSADRIVIASKVINLA